MTITFETDSDVIVYALEKIISFARENQYLFVANCAWWISGIIGLDSGLVTFIDNLEIRRRAYRSREISNTPRDITRLESVDPEQIKLEETIIQQRNPPKTNRVAKAKVAVPDYIPDPLRRTRKGKINPIPLTKRQLKKARQKKRREGIQINQLEEIRARIIENLIRE
jgi:hypothetical protein